MSSKRIEEHTLKVLEYPAVLELAASFVASGLGRRQAMELYPSLDEGWIASRLAETREMQRLLESQVRVPLAGLHDVEAILARVGQAQTVLEPGQLLEVSDTLSASGRLREFFTARAEETPTLAQMGERLDDFSEIVAEIERCIQVDETVRDEASDKLREIRRRSAELGEDIQRKCRQILDRPDMKGAVENERFLTRNGRAVIALKSTHRDRLRGMILDRSNSGFTLYIEPYELAELSNQLEELYSEERSEVTRILWQLTRLVLDRRSDVLRSLRALGQVDLTYGKARFAIAYRMQAPQLVADGPLRLEDSRHPLLMAVAARRLGVEIPEALEAVVPTTIRLGDDFDLLIVTGPNAGGKTVTLKTIGLLTLMVQSGMAIPAGANSQMPVYRQVFADIGDEQSLEQNLSTFTSHMTNIVRIVERANPHSLVLLDELGAGTDPGEGVGLALAILDRLRLDGAKVVATTHLGKVKSYAYLTDRVENASVEFDVKTLEPTYRLLLGTPGSSNALVIAQRLGMPKRVVHHAQTLMDTGRDSQLLNQVQAMRRKAEKSRQHAMAMVDRLRGLLALATERVTRLDADRAALAARADAEIDRAMREALKRVGEHAHRLANAPKPFSEEAQRLAEDLAALAANTSLARQQRRFVESVRKGDTVYVAPFEAAGAVTRLHRGRETMVVEIAGKQIEVPFSEVYPDKAAR